MDASQSATNRRDAAADRPARAAVNRGDDVRDERDARADARDSQADERESIADERENNADARDDVSVRREREVAKVLSTAAHRDTLAHRRDAAANERDVQANLDAFLTGDQDEKGFAARGLARQDRRDSRLDRASSAEDRSELSTPVEELRLPVSLPIQRGLMKPLQECTTDELSSHSAWLLRRAVRQTRKAIEIVEAEGKFSPRARALVQASRKHHDSADDLLWYVTTWLRTGTRPATPLR